MDKGLMALMGIEDDFGRDEGLLERQHQSREPTPFSDDDGDIDDLDISTSTSQSQGTESNTQTGSSAKPQDTVMTTPRKPSSGQQDPLNLIDIDMDNDSEEEPLIPSAVTSNLNSLVDSRQQPNSAYSVLPRESPGLFSLELRPAPRANTSSLFGSNNGSVGGSGGGSIRIAKSPKKMKKNNSMSTGDTFFSPTLSPRKLKKAHSSSAGSGFMSPTLSPVRRSKPQQSFMPARPAQSDTAISPKTSSELISPLLSSLSPTSPPPPPSSFVLKKTDILFSDDSDSDVDSMNGDNIFSQPPLNIPRHN
ncbi:hypothetical protein BG004_002469, partial [Podila humilis]